jgi:threonine synthase
VEPTSAAAPAALEGLLADGTIGSGETVAIVLTGSGLKATDKIVSHRSCAGEGVGESVAAEAQGIVS